MYYFILFLLFHSIIGQEIVCDSNVSCNVDTSHSFEHVYNRIITYPTLGNTVVDGVEYDAVIKLNVLEGNSLSYSWELFNIDPAGEFNCNDSRLWLNGTTVAATTYLRGPTNEEPYCIFDIHDGIFSRHYLLDPVNMYLLLNGTVPVSNSLMVQKNFAMPVIAKQDIKFYLYYFYGASAESEGAYGDGSTLTIDIRELEYNNTDFEGIGSCNTMDTIMSSIQLGECTYNLESGGNGTYNYFIPKEDYDPCSSSRTFNINEIIYSLPIKLPVDVGTCSYFRNYDSEHLLNVFIPRTFVEETSELTRNVFVDVVDYKIEICDPSFYIIPQARTFFTMNFTFFGDQIELLQMPYLGNNANVLEEQSRTCVPHPSGYGTICTFVFRTLLCRPVYTTNDDTCTFDRNDDGVIKDIKIEVIDGVIVIEGIQSEVELQEFDPKDCDPGELWNIVNVTDSFVGNVTMRNLPNPYWETEPEFVAFYDPIIVQMDLDIITEFEHVDVNLMSLLFKIRDPADNSIISQYTFNKIDKILLNNNEATHYYDDSHYCTFQHNGTCSAFYDEQSDRINPYTAEHIMPVINDTCQLYKDTTSRDYFVMTPTNWFADIQIPLVIIDVQATAVLFVCNEKSTASRRLREDRMLQGSEIILFMEYKADAPIRTEFYTEAPTNAPTGSPTWAPTYTGQTYSPTDSPTLRPTTGNPTTSPTTGEPTRAPTESPSTSPSKSPSSSPTTSPTTGNPTTSPTTAAPTPCITDETTCTIPLVIGQLTQLGILMSLGCCFNCFGGAGCRRKKKKKKYEKVETRSFDY